MSDADDKPCGPYSCRECANLVRASEGWEMPHIQWWECAAPKSKRKANLRSFPFLCTCCPDFVPYKTEKE
jgi:hypothetical protein